jgi:putative peptidoglycan lipid II flippase
VVTTRDRLISAAGLLLLASLGSRLFGLVRDQVIAGLFGESAVVSAFSTATTVPTLFYDLVIGGAVSAALVPVLSGLWEGDERREFGSVVGTLLIGGAAILVAIVTALLLLAEPMAWLLGTGSRAATYAETVQFVRLVAPALVFLGLSGIGTAVCYARQQFLFPALSISLFNVGIIVAALGLHRQLGGTSLAAGMLLGAALQCCVVLPGLRGTSLRLTFRPHHAAVRKIIRLYAPVAVGLVVSEIGVVVDRNLANHTGDTSVALMRFATNLVQLPLGLVATATSLAALPVLARLVDDPAEFRATLATGLRLALLAILPLAAFLVVFATPVLRLLYERGAFDAAATEATARAFLLYAPQIPFVAVDQLLIYAFYARKDTLTPMLVGLAGVGVYLASALVLIGPFQLGVHGLILANTLQNSLHAVVLFVLLSRAIGDVAGQGVGVSLRQGLAAALGAGLLAVGAGRLVAAPGGTIGLALYLALLGAGLVTAYCAILFVFGQEELRAVPRTMRARLRPVPVQGGKSDAKAASIVGQKTEARWD